MHATSATTPAAEDDLVVFVLGRPAPQGSKRYLGRGVVVESAAKTLAPWRADIREAVLATWGQRPPLAGPLHVELDFVLPRPASAPKRSTPPAVRRPDLDKLVRAVLDALGSAGVWRDDSQVVELHATKRLAGLDEPTGCRIRIHAHH